MTKLNKIALMGTALALCLSGTAQAATTRSGDAVPAVGKKAPKRTVAAVRGKRSAAGEDTAIIAAAAVGTLVVGGIALADSGNDSPG
ncbi:hypothetical protein [Novosphingobium olei]|uniref:Uncharacterized protein n=1 Tax=Novosphingobium olei TaxID=2728851 RepID=A0A7Y0GAY9_9SPHN|nr:hypothetical protein [Novosphingobium olei]NML94419.1 hypothetical protein [Novosphingobium olei]